MSEIYEKTLFLANYKHKTKCSDLLNTSTEERRRTKKENRNNTIKHIKTNDKKKSCKKN